MPITLKSLKSAECTFLEWSLSSKDRARLVEIIAYLYLRQEENAQKVIAKLQPRARPAKGRVAQNVVRKLTAPNADDVVLSKTGTDEEKKKAKDRINVAIYHRDGLLFQHVSWVVSRLAFPAAVMTSPHVRKADKGFDGFIIQLDADGEQIERIVLCEDKASHKPRPIITNSVWPEITSILAGDRDDEVLAELVTLLKSLPEVDAEAVVDDFFWGGTREFRVAVATGDDQRKHGSFEHLLEGFRDVAGGTIKTRSGGVMSFEDVRGGLASLAQDVIERVKEISGV